MRLDPAWLAVLTYRVCLPGRGITRIGRFAIEASLDRQTGCHNGSMPLERTPQKISGDGLHFGPGVNYRPASRVGPAEQVPIVLTASQSKRASQIQRNASDVTAVDRAGCRGCGDVA